ncbi:MAG TPA: glycerophosphodiester phosphodiesterase [Candidatus Deferrimicrobium sp.]|nr:glycerophosphodiester phosphodiesterase [Candidatus Deferrimicrobium sp.]
MRPYFPGREPGRPIFVAHRGASDRALENSPAAFALAVSDGADMIEFDVRLSADGVPVVFHDDRTGRTAREKLAVARTAASRLRSVRLKNGEKLPFLADVLEIVGGKVPINIESKAKGGIAAAAKALSAAGYRGELLLSSGLRGECLAARDLLPRMPCGLVTRRPSASDLAFCLRRGLSSIHPSRRLLTVLRLRKVAASGIPLLPYTVDDPKEAFALIAAGAAGVFSNRAKLIKEIYFSQFPDR